MKNGGRNTVDDRDVNNTLAHKRCHGRVALGQTMNMSALDFEP